MSKPMVVVMDDDAGTRMMVGRVLERGGFDVKSAENGAVGLQLILEYQPQLVISDIQMPKMDGFAVVQAVRANPTVAMTPIILLTSLQERNHMRQGMTKGADDYLTKPFSPAELQEAVDTQIDKLARTQAVTGTLVDHAVGMALAQQKEKIKLLYEKRLERALADQWPTESNTPRDEVFEEATVVYADLANYEQWSAELDSEELGRIIKQFYTNAGDTTHLFGSHFMQFVGNGFLCVFVPKEDNSVNHALRGVKTARALLNAQSRMNAYAMQHFPDRKLPDFELRIAVHSGAVTFAQLEGGIGTAMQSMPLGQTVSCVLSMYKNHPHPEWPVSLSEHTFSLVESHVEIEGAVEMVMHQKPLHVFRLKSVH